MQGESKLVVLRRTDSLKSGLWPVLRGLGRTIDESKEPQT